MKKIVVFGAAFVSLVLSGCAPQQPSFYTPNPYEIQMQEAKRKDAEFAEKVRNINLETEDVGTKPSNYKKNVENAIREQLKDPESAKFSGMTNPRKEVMVENGDFVYGYSTCVYVNAKNSYGGYVGKQLYWAFLRDNQVLRVKNTNDSFGDIIFVGRPVNCN
ncbi:Uncharacterised protein [Serratia grimesii]|uniref:hypothetical protein n=1 Tax=Serratia grimesii TaxID=82995 RepID=UPI002178DC56|nr:hypothetical protein [Serratia grimesii]CAI1532463.1 Uncharacterised protein [Serratia grimesii]